ncbi:MAG: S24 family peptidase [Gammaproteobacteria bacterium]|nr:S24 family peptidase [Gammaproteobacteria bacterium]
MSGCSGSEPFALRVLGDSMEPEFENGSVVIFEPAVSIEDGCYVIALHESEYVFRQLRRCGDIWQLSALHPDYPVVEIAGLDAIKGRAIAKTDARGRNRKNYT